MKIMELYWKSIDLALCDIKVIESIQATTAILSHTKRIQWTTHKKIVFLTHCVWNVYSITILQWWDYNNIQHIESMKRKHEKSIEFRERERKKHQIFGFFVINSKFWPFFEYRCFDRNEWSFFFFDWVRLDNQIPMKCITNSAAILIEHNKNRFVVVVAKDINTQMNGVELFSTLFSLLLCWLLNCWYFMLHLLGQLSVSKPCIVK